MTASMTEHEGRTKEYCARIDSSNTRLWFG